MPALVRAGDWWDYKVLPILSAFAATALVLRTPLAPLWASALLLVVALTIGAVFASLINDVFDIADDRLAGKPNVLTRLSPALAWAMLVLVALGGAAFAWSWRSDPLLVTVYVAAWLAFVAYSVPPLRLKARGGWGVLAMAFGEAALPSTVAVLACGFAAGRAAPWPWIAVVAVWSCCHGARAILWHQLGDAAADSVASVDTLVRRRGTDWVRAVATRLIFPIELAALAVLLVLMHSLVPALALGGYLALLWLRVRLGFAVATVVAPVPRHVLVLQDFYVGFLPLAVAVALALRNAADLLLLPALLLLFPLTMVRITADAFRLARQATLAAR